MKILTLINEIVNKYNTLSKIITNIEKYVGIKEENDIETITGKIKEIEQKLNNTRQIIDDRLQINSELKFILSKKPKTNSNIYVKIYENINNEIAEIAEIENEDFIINYESGEIEISSKYNNEFSNKYAKAIYITEEE